MKVLYTVYNPKNPVDISILFSQENAKLSCEHINSPWRDEEGKVHQPEAIYEIGAETFRDEEWPTVQRLLGMMNITPQSEETSMEEIREEIRLDLLHLAAEKKKQEEGA